MAYRHAWDMPRIAAITGGTFSNRTQKKSRRAFNSRDFFKNVAVKERFELSIQFLVYTLSRRAP